MRIRSFTILAAVLVGAVCSLIGALVARLMFNFEGDELNAFLIGAGTCAAVIAVSYLNRTNTRHSNDERLNDR